MHPRLAQALLSPRASAAWQAVHRFWPRRVRFFHQVDDPHSHQLLCLLPALRARHDIPVEVRVVPPPTAAHDPDAARAKAFAARDAAEWARFYDVERPGALPEPEAVRAAQAQLLPLRAPGGLDRAVQICRALWSGARLEGGADPESGLAENQAALHASGHYRGGTLWFEGDHYPGLARIGRLEAALGTGAPSVLEARSAPEPAVERLAPGTTLEWFYSFRSPYSYLSVGLVRDLVARYDVNLTIRPVLPMVMRGLPVPFRKRLFLARDAKREALVRGLPFGRIADPVGLGVERLLALFEVAASRGVGLDFLEAAGAAVWAEGLDVRGHEALREVGTRVGLGTLEVERALRADTWGPRVRENRAALLELGLWGVPSFSVPGFSTWGQDRLFMLEARLPPRA